jgi:hypothetical protein
MVQYIQNDTANKIAQLNSEALSEIDKENSKNYDLGKDKIKAKIFKELTEFKTRVKM